MNLDEPKKVINDTPESPYKKFDILDHLLKEIQNFK